MTCYDCDGRGWMDLEEFRDTYKEEVIGDDTALYFLNSRIGLSVGICPSCDGFGKGRLGRWLSLR